MCVIPFPEMQPTSHTCNTQIINRDTMQKAVHIAQKVCTWLPGLAYRAHVMNVICCNGGVSRLYTIINTHNSRMRTRYIL